MMLVELRAFDPLKMTFEGISLCWVLLFPFGIFSMVFLWMNQRSIGLMLCVVVVV
jgi:hypothetical protein